MKQLLILIVGVLGLVAGALVAGRPEDVPNDLEASEITPSTMTSSSASTTTSAAPATTAEAQSTASAPSTSTAPSSSEVETTTGLTTTRPTTTTPRTTTTTPPTTTTTVAIAVSGPTTGVADDGTADAGVTTTLRTEAAVVVVVANGSNTFGLATQSAERIREFGYVFVTPTDGLQEQPETALYFAEGYEAEARRLADQLGASDEVVSRLPTQPLFVGTARADVLVLLGNDWREATNLET